MSAPKRLHTFTQYVHTHVVIPDIETASRLCGGAWPVTLTRALQCSAPCWSSSSRTCVIQRA